MRHQNLQRIQNDRVRVQALMVNGTRGDETWTSNQIRRGMSHRSACSRRATRTDRGPPSISTRMPCRFSGAYHSRRLLPATERLCEPHWHPQTAEMGYVLEGRERMTILDPDGTRDTYELHSGDVYFIPPAYPAPTPAISARSPDSTTSKPTPP